MYTLIHIGLRFVFVFFVMLCKVFLMTFCDTAFTGFVAFINIYSKTL